MVLSNYYLESPARLQNLKLAVCRANALKVVLL
jgi:hypothetical protein